METYTDATRQLLEANVNWLKEWACSRQFGLGTRLPFDEHSLIDSLSDSTIYMAFYTIAHLLQGGVLDGSQAGPAGIRPDQLNDEVWDYVMGEGAYPASSGIPQNTLDTMKREFNFW